MGKFIIIAAKNSAVRSPIMGTWASASLTFLIAMRVRTTMGVDRIRLICACFPLVIPFFFKKKVLPIHKT